MLQLLLWPALLIGAELGYRGYLAMRGKGYDRSEVEAQLARLVSSMTDELPRDDRAPTQRVPPILHPYVGFAPNTITEKITRELRRYSPPPAEDEIRVLITGGSVAGNFGRKGVATLAAELGRMEAFAGKRFVWVNYGLGGHKQPQQLMLASFLFSQGLNVDAVLNLDGFNEVALGNNNAESGAHPAFPSIHHWAHLTRGSVNDSQMRERAQAVIAVQDRAEQWAERAGRGLPASALLGHWVLGRVKACSLDYSRAFDAYSAHLMADGAPPAARGPGFVSGTEMALALDTWERSSELLADLCQARGMAYLHVLQPTLHDTGSKPLTAEEGASSSAHDGWIRGTQLGYPDLRERGATLAQRGVAFHDASRVFAEVNETLYYDVCHFLEGGHKRLARAIAPALGAALEAAPAAPR